MLKEGQARGKVVAVGECGLGGCPNKSTGITTCTASRTKDNIAK